MYSKLEPHLGSRILEVGCGVGAFTTALLDRGKVCAIDSAPEAIEYLKSTLGVHEGLDLRLGSIDDPEFVGSLPTGFDSALMVNVLEHVKEEHAALSAVHGRLAPGGKLVILAPAGTWLNGTLDEAFGHYRRYTKRSLAAVLQESGFAVTSMQRFNALGVPGWLVAGRVLRHRTLKPYPMRAYNFVLPLARRLEDRLGTPVGLSLIAVGTRM